MVAFKYHTFADHVVLENIREANCLRISCKENQKVDISEIRSAEINEQSLSSKAAFGLLGIFRLLLGPYVCVITKAELVCPGPKGTKIFCIHDCDLFPLLGSNAKTKLTSRELRDEKIYVELLKLLIKSKSFYFSYDFEITHTAQRLSEVKGDVLLSRKAPCARAERRFYWNKHLVADLEDLGMDKWLLVVTNGFFRSVSAVNMGSTKGSLYFFARRSCRRAGTRFHMRGSDRYGQVANYVESEVLFEKPDGSVISHVQVRGSVPLYWDQPPTLKKQPRVRYFNSTQTQDYNEGVLNQHLEEHLIKYGRLCIVNLLRRNGRGSVVQDESQLGSSYMKYVKRLQEGRIKAVWFDIHAECGYNRYQNLEKLMTQLDEEFWVQNCFKVDAVGRVQERQNGVFRVNCMDNADRTNIVQAFLSRRAIMQAVGQLEEQDPPLFSTSFESFEIRFKQLWTDHGDAISEQYTGTKGLRSDFQRTGKHGAFSKLKDGIKSTRRYFINNFRDGFRQDAYDLFLGHYVPLRRRPSPFDFRYRHPVLAMFIDMWLASALTIWLVFISVPSTYPLRLVMERTLVGLAVSLLLVVYLVMVQGKLGSLGRRFVSKPALCPDGYPEYK